MSRLKEIIRRPKQNREVEVISIFLVEAILLNFVLRRIHHEALTGRLDILLQCYLRVNSPTIWINAVISGSSLVVMFCGDSFSSWPGRTSNDNSSMTSILFWEPEGISSDLQKADSKRSGLILDESSSLNIRDGAAVTHSKTPDACQLKGIEMQGAFSLLFASGNFGHFHSGYGKQYGVCT